MPLEPADNSNKVKYAMLTPEDIEFYERVNDNVTGSLALPFEIPVDAFFRNVVRGLKFFWTWYENATQEQMLFIPRESIEAVTPVGGNRDLLLPNGIEGIIDWKSAAPAFGLSGRVNDYLRISLLQTYHSSGYGANRGTSYGMNPPSVSNAVISLYEVNQYRETFTRGIRASYNKNTQIFRLMTNIPDGLVLQAMVRLQPSQLYDDQLFEDYITALIEQQLGRIVMSFDFKLPGSVQINYDEIRSKGNDERKEIEDAIKTSNNNDMIQYK